ncbi:alpha/beta fold hydrolase [Nocardioides abyssi]|uniref:Alpha/beta fold hydrolase n=1 Tax=Nocardioides abyssi TaxID=3058370 RepID=A0ABT8ETR4_9ACTN|nr:alpha/beta fold hydrolase [Nocardioides abyssi]MDN4161316.1 alpha/beta fold hydrolase [Nocardioides abyssi]
MNHEHPHHRRHRPDHRRHRPGPARPLTASLTAVRLGGRPDHPLLVLGPSLGTSATALWSACARTLARDFQVVAWDLPGHGTNRTTHADRAAGGEPLTVADLAGGVLDLVGTMSQGLHAPSFHYAGDSVGGAVGLQLLLDAPHRVESATLLGTGARLGEPATWLERADTVRERGTEALVEASNRRWFGPGFVDRDPERVSALLTSLTETDDEAYAAVCAAIAAFDVRDRLRSAEVAVPVLAVAGSHDVPTPPGLLLELATATGGTFVELDGVGHLAPAEAPDEVARLVREHALGPEDDAPPPELDHLADAVRAALAAGFPPDDLDAVVRRVLAE